MANSAMDFIHSNPETYNGYTGDMFYVDYNPDDFDTYWRTDHDSPGFGLTEGNVLYDPNSALAKVYNFFTGKVSSARQSYDNYLANWEYNRNKQMAEYNNWLTRQREDTAVQRAKQDYVNAGFSPFAMFSGGASAPSSAMSYATHKRPDKSQEDNDSKLLNSALRLLTLILLKKA